MTRLLMICLISLNDSFMIAYLPSSSSCYSFVPYCCIELLQLDLEQASYCQIQDCSTEEATTATASG